MFNFLNKKGTDTSNTKDSIKLESLASKPENNKNINMMVSALKNAVDNENNYNIGITGSYGSGKSSIIKSYEKNNNKNLLYISLAILNENDNNDTNNNQDVSPLEERLEKAIVNQIVHQIDPSYIPQSFLKSKKEKNYILNTGLMFVGILLLLLNIPASYNYIAGIIANTFLLSYIGNLRSLVIFSTVLYLLFISFYIAKRFNFSSIIKLKSEFYELEANTNENTNNNSYFDKHLDDILYCISQSKCDAIVFEDIDRFNNQEIFIKLKEINNLLNNRHIFGKSNICKKIPFIYAMNDDLFKSNDKTKFFDVVIPVIPYINGDNSAEIFDTLFKNKEKIKPDSVVLSILSHYITDMRLLKNIYNEYIIYIGILGSNNKFQQHDYNQLFSLIVYKNLYPTDFSNLQFNKGNLYNVINSRSKIVQEQNKSLTAQIDKIEDEIEKIENEFLQNKYELDILYSYSNSGYSQYLPREPLIKSFKNLSMNIDDNNDEYKERLKTIENKNNNYINILRSQINELEKKMEIISSLKFSSLIQDIEDINKYIESQKIEKNHLQFIRILLVNDFVNEDYRRYLSHFHQGNASDKDKNFINSVYAKEQPKYDEELDNIEWITSKINSATLDNNFAVLNYSLLYYLLKNNKNYELNKLYFQILELIKMYKDKYIFIIGFYKYYLNKDLIKNKDLLNDLYKHNPELVSDIFLYETSVASDKYAVIYYSVIKNSNNIEIDNIYYNEDESIKKYISNYVSESSVILTSNYIIKDVYWHYLENFNIKFQNLTYIDKDNLEEGKLERFLSHIFQEDLYEVNEKNINYLVNNYLKLKENESVQDKSNYEIYLHNLYDKADVLNEFIKFLNLNTDDSIKFEYSKDIEKLIINNEKVSIDDVITFLEKYDIIIDDISIVRDELWDNLLNNSNLLINPVWSNIINYYNKYKDDKDKKSNAEAHIKEFLLQHTMLDNLDVNSNKILFTLIIENEVETEKFFNIIQNFEQSDNIPTDIPININNMKALLQNKIFAPTKENFDICYNKYRNIFHYFILNNIQLYIENINSYIISKEQLEYVVNVNSIDIHSLFIIVHHYFANSSYASYRDIKINNTVLLEKIFISELDKTIKVIVFKNNIDVITKTDSLLLYSLSHLLDNNLYNRIKKLFNQNYKSIRLSQEQFNGSNDILNLLIEKNILVKKEHSQHIELSISDDYLALFLKK